MSQLNLTRHLTVLMAVLIFVTASAAALPTYIIIRNELERQTWLRVQDARQNSNVILEFERAQLEKTVTLAAQRPTLKRLASEQNYVELDDYLRDFQTNTTLDFLYLDDASGKYLSGIRPDSQAVTIQITLPVEAAGFITGGILLDDEFAEQLHIQTGFTYEFLPPAELAQL
ncbi:MAG TPA: hypothetical protein VHL11_13855, partial [Phototrophicaceae bacterium]|nr:hypothetical protein [Phototrophicaceae bacterium]